MEIGFGPATAMCNLSDEIKKGTKEKRKRNLEKKTNRAKKNSEKNRNRIKTTKKHEKNESAKKKDGQNKTGSPINFFIRYIYGYKYYT